MEKFGCPNKFITILQQLHDNMVGRVLTDGGTTEPFPISTGVKQGCVLAPTLFGLYFTAMFSTIDFSNCLEDIYIRFRQDGSVFDLRRLNSKTAQEKL